MIRFSCPHCHKAYQVGDDFSGKRVKCKACGGALSVPMATGQENAAAVSPEKPVEAAGTSKPPPKGKPVISALLLEGESFSAEALREWVIGIVCYVLDKGPVLKDGNTIGVDAQQRIRIRHAPSSYGKRGTVLRLEI